MNGHQDMNIEKEQTCQDETNSRKSQGQMYVLKREYYLGRPNNRVYSLVEAKGDSAHLCHPFLINR